jgi:hypothetical protein
MEGHEIENISLLSCFSIFPSTYYPPDGLSVASDIPLRGKSKEKCQQQKNAITIRKRKEINLSDHAE